MEGHKVSYQKVSNDQVREDIKQFHSNCERHMSESESVFDEPLYYILKYTDKDSDKHLTKDKIDDNKQ